MSSLENNGLLNGFNEVLFNNIDIADDQTPLILIDNNRKIDINPLWHDFKNIFTSRHKRRDWLKRGASAFVDAVRLVYEIETLKNKDGAIK